MQEAIDSSTLIAFKQQVDKIFATLHMQSELKYKFSNQTRRVVTRPFLPIT
jgi:hypothetical protein